MCIFIHSLYDMYIYLFSSVVTDIFINGIYIILISVLLIVKTLLRMSNLDPLYVRDSSKYVCACFCLYLFISLYSVYVEAKKKL